MDLTISGRHALLFDDDATAAFVNSPSALVPWTDDAALLIDRYDVRHLLDRIPARRPRAPPLCDPDLDLHRYLDLPQCGHGDQHSETIKKSEATNSGAYQAVPLFYGNDDSVAATKDSDSGSSSIFYPPFDVPKNLVSNLPPTEKLHQIISRTAMFVSNHGGQSEIVLRVKQGDNPTFGFLMPDNRLHAYFRYLVDHPELINGSTYYRETQEKASENQDNKAHIAAGGALSMLGSVYDSEDDDDAVGHPQSKEMMSDKSNVPGDPIIPPRLKSEEYSTSTVSEDKETSKAATGKERILLPKRNPVVNFASFSVPRSNKEGDDHSSTRVALVKPVIVEPPSALKEAIDKIVEFILRNGKQFEAVLIAQDKTAGRFPFLLPSNQYHPYYLKLLEEEQESKLMGKNLSHHKHDAHGHDGSKKRRRDSPQKGTNSYDSNLTDKSEACGLLINEKCKTLIVAAKNDAHDDQPPAHGRQSSLSADEVAAIVMAVTRGSSPANAVQRPRSARQSGASADEAAAIVLAATRGLSPADADQLPIPVKPHGGVADESHTTTRGLSPAKEGPLPSPSTHTNEAVGILHRESKSSSPIDSHKCVLMEELDAGRTREDSGRASSTRSFSPSDGGIGCRSVSKGKTDKALPGASLSTGKHDTVGSVTASDVLVAKVIADTVACAASNEANSSEACLTKEQRQKAERLKRAKMFAAVIKSGTCSVTDFVRSSSVPSGSLVDSNADSIRSSAKMDFVNQEREASFDSEISDKVKSQGNDARERRSRKTYRSTNRDHVDEVSDEDRNTSRKKHRSRESPLHSRDHHRHQKYPYTCREKESRHGKHHSPREDDYKHSKRSSYRRRYMDDLSENDDDERVRSDVHRRKHEPQPHLERKGASEVDSRVKTSVYVDARVPTASDAQQPDASQVPSDLRAKIRAMLLETL